jgi:hypothetical protein
MAKFNKYSLCLSGKNKLWIQGDDASLIGPCAIEMIVQYYPSILLAGNIHVYIAVILLLFFKTRFMPFFSERSIEEFAQKNAGYFHCLGALQKQSSCISRRSQIRNKFE